MGRGRQAHDHQAGPRVSESGHAASPVLLVPELPLPLLGDPGTIADQPGAPDAGDHLPADLFERVGHAGPERSVAKGSRGGIAGYSPHVT